MPSRLARLIGSALIVAATTAASGSSYQPRETFAPFDMGQAVNDYRGGDGLPGPAYWQNRADYQIHATLDKRAQALSGEEAISLQAETEERVKAALDVFREKLVKRNISMKALDAGDARASGKIYKIDCKVIQGIDSDKAKAIGKKIRDEGPKGVQAQIQGDQLRVTAKKKDDLQAVIALLKTEDFGVALQFNNYR